MILQALKEYYDRKLDDPDSDIAPEGFEWKEIPFVVVIKSDGSFVNVDDTREKKGIFKRGKPFLLPRSQKRSGSRSYETTFLLWDHSGYLFEHPASDSPKDKEKASKQHRVWLNSLKNLPAELLKDNGVSAIKQFYENNSVEAVKSDPKWEECVKRPSCNMTFRLANDTVPVPCRSAVREYVKENLSQAVLESRPDDIVTCCLVTGKRASVARTHGRTPINKDTKSLVAFQKNSGYDSYGKEQGFNAPVSISAEFAYTTALNTLLNSRSRMIVGDAVTVCWAERDSILESSFPDFFHEPPKDDPDRGVEAVRSLYRAVDSGALQTETNNRFYVLGLAPNSARIAVRFWIVDTVPGMAGKICSHFEDTRICHGPRDYDALSLFRLLVSTAALGKAENIPPNLAGETMRAILQGLAYPQTLLQAAVRRIRAEHDITYPRASLIKACINRSTRFRNPKQKEELKVSLDKTNNNIGYLLGRLFAELEKLQIRVFTQGGGKPPNSTIRDKYYGSASGTPATVFGTLIRLSKHHLAKLENVGERVNYEKRIGTIMEGISDFPSHLSLADQGRFAIGYYHQMNAPKNQYSESKTTKEGVE